MLVSQTARSEVEHIDSCWGLPAAGVGSEPVREPSLLGWPELELRALNGQDALLKGTL